MEEVAKLLNRMVKEEAILDYAVFGAVEDDQISALAQRHGLPDAWTKCLERFNEA